MKSCIKCSIEKDDGEFGSGRNVCKICRKEQNKQWYQNNAEAVKEREKQYRQNNAEAIKERKKHYYQNNAEVIKEYKKQYRQNNLEAIKERQKQYYENNIQKINKRTMEYRKKNPWVTMLSDAKRRAKEKNIPFSLKKEDIFIPENCPILGIPLERAIGKKSASPNSPSLDRIIPEKGYVKGNIIVISYKANTMKSDATPEEMIKLGEYAKKLLEEANKNE